MPGLEFGRLLAQNSFGAFPEVLPWGFFAIDALELSCRPD